MIRKSKGRNSKFILTKRAFTLGRTPAYFTMGNSADKPTPVPENKGGEKKLKPCCACPETKKVRDQCIIEKGEENCGDLIEKHKECMRSLGFKI